MAAKKRKRMNAMHLLGFAGVCLCLALIFLICTIVMSRRASNAKEQTKTFEAQLKKSEEEKKALQGQLEEKQEYLDEWNGVFEQLEKEADGTSQETAAETVENYDSPYQAVHEDMRVTKEDLQAAVPQQKTVYLTFDDGPSARTGEVLDALDVYGMKATFFVTYTDKPELQKYYSEIVNRGHTIAVHTASHEYNTIYSSVDNYLEDFYKVYQLIYEQTGVRPTIFRYPGGSTSLRSRDAGAGIAQEMKSRGFVYFDWNVSCGDGSNRATEDSILQAITEGVAKYQTSVVLMHDTRQPTVNILPEVLKQLSETGAKFESLNQNCKRVQFYDRKY